MGLKRMLNVAKDDAGFSSEGGVSRRTFLKVGADTVTLIMPQVEMGQGIYTSMPMLFAEELEVDLGQIALEAAPADDRRYANLIIGFQVTGGSTRFGPRGSRFAVPGPRRQPVPPAAGRALACMSSRAPVRAAIAWPS
jgi:hypothetical protein